MSMSGKVQQYWGPNSHYLLECDWSATNDTTNNKSVITAQMWLWADSGWGISSSATKTGNIKGNTGGNSSASEFPISQAGVNDSGGSWIKLGAQQSWNVYHNSDGTGSFLLGGDFNFDITINGTYYGDIVLPDTTFALDTIPRATTLSSPNPPNWTASDNVLFNLNRQSQTFSETVLLEVQNSDSSWRTIKQYTGVGDSCNFQFTTADNTNIFQALAQRASTATRLTITTYDNYNSTGNVVGTNVYTGTVTAPAATTASANNFNIGDTVPITLNPYTSAFTHTLQWSWVNYNATLATGVTGTSYSWNTSAQDSGGGDTYANLMYKQIPNSPNNNGTLTCTTYYNGVQVRSPVNYQNVKGSVVNSNPTFSTIGYLDAKTLTANLTGNNQYIIQNQSDFQAKVLAANYAVAKNYATMSQYIAVCNGQSVVLNSPFSGDLIFDFGALNAAQNVNLTITAYDSRGFTTAVTVVVNVIPYQPPVVKTNATRENGFSANTDLTLSGSISSINVGGEKNNLNVNQCTYATAQSGGSYGAATPFSSITVTMPNYSAPTTVLNLANTNSWNIKVIVTDQLTSTTVILSVGTGVPLWFLDQVMKSLGLGKLPTANGLLDVAWDIHTDGKLSSKRNTLDDGSGNATINGSTKINGTTSGAFLFMKGESAATGYGATTYYVADEGTQQGATRLRSYYPNKWAIEHSTGTQAYGSDPSTMTYATTLITDRASLSVATKNNTLDDGSGNATFNGKVTANGLTLSTAIALLTPITNFYSSLLLGWVVYGGSPTYQYPAYYQTADGMVHLMGSMKSGSNGTIYTIPVGLRPANKLNFNVNCGTGYQNGYLTVDNAGNIAVFVPSGANTFVSLDGISWMAQQ